MPKAFTALGAPALFVFLWSTGWISARAAAPFTDPLTFLAIRFGLAGLLLTLFSLAARAAWPKTRADWLHAMVTGFLLHAVYLGPVWWAIKQGLPAGISGLIAALQPLFTAALAAPLAGERLTGKQKLGVAVGLLGVALVLYPKLAGVGPFASGNYFWPIVVNVLGMFGVTAGTFYQKRFVRTGELRTITAVQYLGATPPILIAALLLEPLHFEIAWPSVLSMAWSVLALSIGGIVLMLTLIRKGAVSRVAALIYLVPPAVALQAWLLFGETLIPLQMLGMAVTAVGVYLSAKE